MIIHNNIYIYIYNIYNIGSIIIRQPQFVVATSNTLFLSLFLSKSLAMIHRGWFTLWTHDPLAISPLPASEKHARAASYNKYYTTSFSFLVDFHDSFSLRYAKRDKNVTGLERERDSTSFMALIWKWLSSSLSTILRFFPQASTRVSRDIVTIFLLWRLED